MGGTRPNGVIPQAGSQKLLCALASAACRDPPGPQPTCDPPSEGPGEPAGPSGTIRFSGSFPSPRRRFPYELANMISQIASPALLECQSDAKSAKTSSAERPSFFEALYIDQ